VRNTLKTDINLESANNWTNVKIGPELNTTIRISSKACH